MNEEDDGKQGSQRSAIDDTKADEGLGPQQTDHNYTDSQSQESYDQLNKESCTNHP